MPATVLSKSQLIAAGGGGAPSREEIEFVLTGGWARARWDVLSAVPLPSCSAQTWVQAAELRTKTSFNRTAETELSDGHAIVRVNLGILGWSYTCARILTPYLVGSKANLATLRDEPIQTSAALIVYSLGWLAAAGFSRESFREELSSTEEEYAYRLSESGELFILAHEMGHVALGHMLTKPIDDADKKAREYVADTWAVDHLVRLSEQNPNYPLGLTLPAVAMLLCSEHFHESYTENELDSHPYALERLRRIRENLPKIDEEDRFGFLHVFAIYDVIMPAVRQRSPHTVLSVAELRQFLQAFGASEELVSSPGSTTWARICYDLAVFLVTECARSEGDLRAHGVESIERLVSVLPLPVIECLRSAYRGDLLEPNDPDYGAVVGFGQELVRMIGDPFLVEAIVDFDRS